VERGQTGNILRSLIQASHLSSMLGPPVNCAAPGHYRMLCDIGRLAHKLADDIRPACVEAHATAFDSVVCSYPDYTIHYQPMNVSELPRCVRA
jgi:hypothetical protein